MRLMIKPPSASVSAPTRTPAPAYSPLGIALLLESRAMHLRDRALRLLEEVGKRDVGDVASAIKFCDQVPLIVPRMRWWLELADRLCDRAQLYRTMQKAAIKATNLNRWE